MQWKGGGKEWINSRINKVCQGGYLLLTKKYFFNLNPKFAFRFHVFKTFCPASILKSGFFFTQKCFTFKNLPNDSFLPLKQFLHPCLRKKNLYWVRPILRNVCNNSEMPGFPRKCNSFNKKETLEEKCPGINVKYKNCHCHRTIGLAGMELTIK